MIPLWKPTKLYDSRYVTLSKVLEGRKRLRKVPVPHDQAVRRKGFDRLKPKVRPRTLVRWDVHMNVGLVFKYESHVMAIIF